MGWSRLIQVVHRWRRWRFLAVVRLRARLARATVDVAVDPGIRFTGRVHVSVGAGSATRVRIGAGCLFEDDVYLFLDGGSLELGPEVRLRRGAILRVRGTLVFEGENFLSYYSIVHCDDSVRIRRRAGISEHVTISDSNHVRPDDGGWFVDRIATAPVDVGEGVWVGAKATIGRGVAIGSDTFVAANAVVTRDLPAGVTAGGIPARVLTPSPR